MLGDPDPADSESICEPSDPMIECKGRLVAQALEKSENSMIVVAVRVGEHQRLPGEAGAENCRTPYKLMLQRDLVTAIE
jgi:hypothetical protein